MNSNSTFANEQENVLAGVVGAFLFSLVGGILWFVLYQIGYLAAISGLVGVICAIKGYTFFAKTKNESVRCIVISVIVAIIVLAISWYFCVAYDIYSAYREWFAAGEVDFYYTFFESVQVVPYFLAEPDILLPYLGELGTGLLLAGIGVVYYLAQREKKQKMQKAAEAEAAAAVESSAVFEETTENTAE